MQLWRALPIVLIAACGSPAKQPTPGTTKASPSTRPATRAGALPSTLTPDVVLATIKDRYLAGVERCYARHAKKHGDVRARVLVSFTVDPRGQARDGEARGIAEHVDSCIAAQVERWRFPAPRDGAGAPTEAHFALGLQVGG